MQTHTHARTHVLEYAAVDVCVETIVLLVDPSPPCMAMSIHLVLTVYPECPVIRGRQDFPSQGKKETLFWEELRRCIGTNWGCHEMHLPECLNVYHTFSPLCECNTFSLFIPQLTNHWTVSGFRLLEIVQLCTCPYTFLTQHVFSILLDAYQGVEWLGHMVIFSKAVRLAVV